MLDHLLTETYFKYIRCEYVKPATRTNFSSLEWMTKFCYTGWAVQEATVAVCTLMLRMQKLLFPPKCPSGTSLRLPTIFSYSYKFT